MRRSCGLGVVSAVPCGTLGDIDQDLGPSPSSFPRYSYRRAAIARRTSLPVPPSGGQRQYHPTYLNWRDSHSVFFGVGEATKVPSRPIRSSHPNTPGNSANPSTDSKAVSDSSARVVR